MDSPLEKVLSRLKDFKRLSNGSYQARCPAHSDDRASLSVREDGPGGKVLLTCFAGCSFKEVMAALGLEARDGFPRDESHVGRGRGDAPAVTLEQFAAAKCLPLQYLTNQGLEQLPDGIKVTYKLMDGSPAPRQRKRTALKAGEGSFWLGPRGASPVPYGLDKLAKMREANPESPYLIFVEGETDALTLWRHRIPALGIPGADMAGKIEADHLDGFHRLYVFQEPDRGGTTFIKKTARRLLDIGFTGQVFSITPPESVKDPNELLQRNPEGFTQGWQEIMDRATQLDLSAYAGAGNTQGTQGESLPRIDAGCQDLRIVTAQAWSALEQANSTAPRIFRRAGAIVRLEYNEKGQPLMVVLIPDRLRYELARCANWYKTTESGQEVAAKPPLDVVRDLLAAPEYPLPILDRIVEVPVFSPAGRLCVEPGYDEEARVFHSPAPGLEVPEISADPGQDDVARARSLIMDELLGEFPFLSQADKANAVALLLLPFVRTMVDGPSPMHLVEAPAAGSGKSLLVDVLLRPALGHNVGSTTEARDEDEWRKRITAALREGKPAVVIDNITRPLTSGALAAALTTMLWSDRLLGENVILLLPVTCAWVCTANNPVVSTEIARRSIRIRIDPRQDRPWLREGFKHADLRAWTSEHRGDLIWAGLTLVNHWVALGQPRGNVKTLGAYEAWSAILGGILEHAEIPGFLGNLIDFYEVADHEGAMWRAFVEEWSERFGDAKVTAKELFPVAAELDGFDLGNGAEKSQRTSFGMKLARQRDRVIGDYRIVEMGKRQRAGLWSLLPADKAMPDKPIQGTLEPIAENGLEDGPAACPGDPFDGEP